MRCGIDPDDLLCCTDDELHFVRGVNDRTFVAQLEMNVLKQTRRVWRRAIKSLLRKMRHLNMCSNFVRNRDAQSSSRGSLHTLTQIALKENKRVEGSQRDRSRKAAKYCESFGAAKVVSEVSI